MSTFFNNNSKDLSQIVKAFISNFISDTFFSNINCMALYPVDITSQVTSHGNDAIQYIKNFLNDLNEMSTRLQITNLNQVRQYIKITNIILNIRETGSQIINYDNVFQHIGDQNITIKNLIQTSINNKIEDNEQFRRLIDEILRSVEAYYEVKAISNNLNKFEEVSEYASKPEVSVFDAIKKYYDGVLDIYADLSKLKTYMKSNSEKNFFRIKDSKSTIDFAKALVDYISEGYSNFKTGYELFDKYIEGFESGKVHLISAPSNHGKSLFMVNLCHKIIEENVDDFEENDQILFITLEDDINSLAKRICSIFGNYKSEVIKDLYRTAYESFQFNKVHGTDNNLRQKVEGIVDNLLKGTIVKTTRGKINFTCAHFPENTFSCGDLTKLIDQHKIEGFNTKLVFVDYVDSMVPIVNTSNMSDYDRHGIIIQEFRNLSRTHKIPIITATQNARSSENTQISMSNSSIGDSYKKVRYTDFLYMCRMVREKTPFDDDVRYYVFDKEDYSSQDTLSPEILKAKDSICDNLICFEIKITKSKDAGRDERAFKLFCKQNLKIYNTVSEYLNDVKQLEYDSTSLSNDITMLNTITGMGNNCQLDFSPFTQDNTNKANTTGLPIFITG